MRTRPTNDWRSVLYARRHPELLEEPAGEPGETFNELRARAKAAGISAAGSRADIEARLAEVD